MGVSHGCEVHWGVVQSLAPTTVRFAGDTADVPVALKSSALSLTVGDKVALVKLGVRDGWCVAFVIGVTS